MSLTFQNKHRYAFYTIAEHDMHFIPMQKWYDIILHCHSNRRGQTLMVSWRRVICDINLRVQVAMVTELCTHFIFAMVWNVYHALQWYEMHTSANFEKSKTHFLNFSQINKFFVLYFPDFVVFEWAVWDRSWSHRSRRCIPGRQESFLLNFKTVLV